MSLLELGQEQFAWLKSMEVELNMKKYCSLEIGIKAKIKLIQQIYINTQYVSGMVLGFVNKRKIFKSCLCQIISLLWVYSFRITEPSWLDMMFSSLILILA